MAHASLAYLANAKEGVLLLFEQTGVRESLFIAPAEVDCVLEGDQQKPFRRLLFRGLSL